MIWMTLGQKLRIFNAIDDFGLDLKALDGMDDSRLEA